MLALLRDLRFSLRVLFKNPGFALAAILILALGIGANTAMFTVASALLLRPFPYHDPQQLVSVESKDKTAERGGTLLRYELLRDRSQSFQSVAAWTNDTFDLTGHGEPMQVPVARVSPSFFPMLGVRPQLGRVFSDAEGRPEGEHVVMLSDALWRSRFGGDPNIVGRTVTLDTAPHTVVGILPADAQFPFIGQADVWTPRYFELTLMTPQRLRSGVGYLSFLARLRSGTTVAQAQSELAVLNEQYRQQNPTAPDADPAVMMMASPLRDLVVANVRGRILMLSAAVAVVLLIACANVASLLLSRALSRRREIAVRTAMGASRGVIVRQLLTESILLALFAGVLGVGLGWAATRAMATLSASQLPQGMPITMDLRVLLFAVGVSLLTGAGFGIFPALQLARADLNTTLREEGLSASAGRERARVRSLLVVGQVALSLLLLIGAGLLLRSFARLLRVDPGFDAHSVLTMNVSLPTVKYAKPEQQIAFFDEVLRRVSALPGVRSAAISAALPLSSKRITPMLPQGQAEVPLAQRPFLDIEAVSPQWFDTMRVPLRGGRWFIAADDAQAPKVIVVNETFARRFWPGENPLGKRVIIGRATVGAEVVGVAGDVKNQGLAEETQAQVYVPFPQLPWGNMNLLVRTDVPPQGMASAVQKQIAAVDADQPVTSIQTVDELMDSSRSQPHFTMMLLAAFSVGAFALAIIGIYGVLAYSVAQRRHEMAIRLALGAERGDILRLVVGQGLWLSVVGIGIGLLAAILMTRLMSDMLYDVSARDLMTFILAPVIFLGVALLASYVPARRATKLNPVEALRQS
ncbi:ABC transporter permease [Alloacidobacterium dinghuense]|uniref:ABC transporter permease n=1 Tax=Alloacidobacterium dinghuense TaxID=2763107 RepID=A0A7G8BCG2_9BACT|nr:ABC transporter permease [Alloacidobacterium dinghuense]QNI30232.1 ABC transporter permease [Alloacidobacterium dinghuense]